MQLHPLRDHLRYTTQPSLFRRLIADGMIWDVVGYALVLCLASYLLLSQLGPFKDATSPAETSYKDSLNSQSAVTLDRRAPQSVKAQKHPISRDAVQRSYPVSVDRMAPDMLLERLELLNERPGWTLLDIDVAQAQKDLAQLIREGDAALPAIAHFLARGSDADFTKGGIDEKVGYPSLRLALFAALERIGGHQVESILYEELHRTQRPTEIEALGHYLNDISPGLYDYDIVNQAKQTFSSIRQESDDAQDQDLGPLFRVFSEYGDASLVPELENISQLRWGKYGAVTLARIKGGEGIPSLASWAEEGPLGNKSSAFALRILAQTADDPVAGNAILKSATENRVGEADWREIAQLISGTYHIQLEPPEQGITTRYQDAARPNILRTTEYTALTPGGGQTLYGLRTGSPVLAPEQIIPRLELIDALLSEVKSPTARRELERAFRVLWSMTNKRDQH